MSASREQKAAAIRRLLDEEGDSVFENGYTTDDDGIVLGLAIVKGIADAHGWSVAVGRSEAGGAAFAFEVE